MGTSSKTGDADGITNDKTNTNTSRDHPSSHNLSTSSSSLNPSSRSSNEERKGGSSSSSSAGGSKAGGYTDGKSGGSSNNNNNNNNNSSNRKSTVSKKSEKRNVDAHPYSRGSVIEVLHTFRGLGRSRPESKSSEEEQEHETNNNNNDNDDEEEDDKPVPWLCDVIDRAQVSSTNNNHHSPSSDDPAKRWRYYVHYRNFNRRMDEWVGWDRIVSPPSIGKAKTQALSLQKKREEEARKKEEERILAEKLEAEHNGEHGDGGVRVTRRQKRKRGESSTTTDANAPGGTAVAAAIDAVVTVAAEELDEHEGLDEASLREHEEVTKVKNVGEVELGQFRMETWYFSPLPKEMMRDGGGFIPVLYVCEFSLNMFVRKCELMRFQAKHKRRHPPGNEIYRNGRISMFEVDGFQQRIYCQNLCYLAKFFLDHKTLYFDVDPFLFYVMCEVDDRGFHPVGYYSKEKYSDVGYNLACILTFPSHQRKGYGRFLISFSYELSKKEEKVGSPEKPMSDLGQQAYKPYWNATIVDFLINHTDRDLSSNNNNGGGCSMSIMDISKKTSIMAEDIIFTLNQLGILKVINGVYFITADENTMGQLVKKHPVKDPRVDPSKLHWTPYLTDIKRDKFSIHSKKPSVEGEEARGAGGF